MPKNRRPPLGGQDPMKSASVAVPRHPISLSCHREDDLAAYS